MTTSLTCPSTRNKRISAACWGVELALLVLFGAPPTVAREPLPAVPSILTSTREALPARSVHPPSVVLISLDGTRPADLTAANLPTLIDLGRRGAKAIGLIPVDPSNTFPSHVSLVTGVRPDVHRLVNNSFIDPKRGRFSKDDAHLWIEAEPIWSIAERHGLPTASFYWVGSEGPSASGAGPGRAKAFSSRTSERVKVDQILEWLSIPNLEQRPRLITSWFHGADHSAHVDGPGADSVRAALASQDEQIARLVRKMKAQGFFESTTLFFVSDHGMTRASVRENLGRRLGRAGLDVSVMGVGGFATIVFKPRQKSAEAIARAMEIARLAGLDARIPSEAPMDWHVDDPRFGDIVVRAPLGTAIVNRFTKLEGFHGYDAMLPEMAGILVAYGRGVMAGAELGRVSSLAIAPTILRLLDLPVPQRMTTPAIERLLVGVGSASADTLDAAGALRETGDNSSP